MFIGVVVKPIIELGLDERIFLKRTSERKVLKETSYNQRFPDNTILNSELMEKIGGWRAKIHDRTLTFYGLAQHMANNYDLDYFVSDHLNFTYAGYGERDSDKKSKFCQEMAELRNTGSRRIDSQGDGHPPFLTWSREWK